MTYFFNFFNTIDMIVVFVGIMIFNTGVKWYSLQKKSNDKKDYSSIFLMILGGLTPIASLKYAQERFESQDYKYIVYTGEDKEYIHYTNNYEISDYCAEEHSFHMIKTI